MTQPWVEAQKEFAGWWVGKDSYCFQFHDTREAMGKVGKTRQVITTAHPSDFLVTHKGVMFYAEVKSCGNPNRFPFEYILKSQWHACRRQIMAQGMYYFFLKRTTDGVWFILDGKDAVRMFVTEELKSVRWDALTPWIPLSSPSRMTMTSLTV